LRICGNVNVTIFIADSRKLNLVLYISTGEKSIQLTMVTRFDSLNSWLSSLTLKIGHHRRSRKNLPNGVPRSSTMASGEELSGVCRSTTFPTLGNNNALFKN